MLWLTIILFIALLLLLVLAHEWGHFMAAKKAGCNVEEFGFGFPPRLFAWRWHGTLYSLNLLPIGGFVKIEGEDMEENKSGPHSFASKSASWRTFILSAGVLMNIVVAFIFFSWQAAVGMPDIVTAENDKTLANKQTYILEVSKDSPAAAAGLQALDRIVSLDGNNQPSITQIQKIAKDKGGQALSITVERQGQHKDLTLTPRQNPPADQGPIGVSLASTGLVKKPWWQAPYFGLIRTGQSLVGIVLALYMLAANLIKEGGDAAASAAGPVGIAVYLNEATKLGLSYVLEFAAMISLNLAIINILPLPALDGGRILFVGLEKLFRRRLPARVEQITHTIGFVLLIGLMVLITFRDIRKLFV